VIFARFIPSKKTDRDNADYQNGDGSKSVKFTKAGNIHVFRFSVLSRKGWEIFPYRLVALPLCATRERYLKASLPSLAQSWSGVSLNAFVSSLNCLL